MNAKSGMRRRFEPLRPKLMRVAYRMRGQSSVPAGSGMMGRELLPLHRRREPAQDSIWFGRFPRGEGVHELEDP